MPDQIVDGDLHIKTITHGSGMYQSKKGSVIIDEKIDDHSNVHIKAAMNVGIGQKIDQHSLAVIEAGADVGIGQKIDQHSQAEITAGGSVTIGQKIDQHSVGIITAQNGNVDIGQKIDQHSWARISVPNGTLSIGEAVDQHSQLHYQARTASIPRVEHGSTSDADMIVGWDADEFGPQLLVITDEMRRGAKCCWQGSVGRISQALLPFSEALCRRYAFGPRNNLSRSKSRIP